MSHVSTPDNPCELCKEDDVNSEMELVQDEYGDKYYVCKRDDDHMIADNNYEPIGVGQPS